MATHNSPVRFVDKQGRFVLPAYVRKHLNVGKGHTIELFLEDDNTVRIKAVPERCCVCCDSIGDMHHTTVETANGDKFVCYKCAQNIARSMIAQMK